MRLFVWALILNISLAALMPNHQPQAQSFDQNRARCVNSNPDISIGGCTLAIQSGNLTVKGLVAAFNNRGIAYGKQELTKYAIENVLGEFFHPIDSFEKALHFAENMSEEIRNWAAGFEMILSQFKQVLLNHGIEEYHSIDKPFDPHFHEAVEMIETEEYEPGIVVEEYVRGYKAGDRAIRVARVKVAKTPEKLEKQNQEEG